MRLDHAMELLAEKDQQVELLAQQIKQLRHQLELALKRLYGVSKETFHPDQLMFDQLLIDNLDQGALGPEPVDEEVEVGPHKRKASPHGRAIIPEHLERVVEVIDIPEADKIDPETGQQLVEIGREVSEKLAYEPGGLYVRVIERPKYAVANAPEKGIRTALLPDEPIKSCKADVSLLAHVCVQKYVDHLPLYRQEQIFAREQIAISRNTLGAWVMGCADALEPIRQALKQAVLESAVIHTDDTPVRMMDPGRGKTKQARMWVYVAGGHDPPYRVFDFSVDRQQTHPLKFLESYHGYVQADAYTGYDELFKRADAIEIGCWAHVRRKFIDAQNAHPRDAAEILVMIQQLYLIEREGAKPGVDDLQRVAMRKGMAAPMLERLYERLEEMRPDTLPQSPLGQAITYAMNQKKVLHRYLEDGRLKIDNNLAENAIRPLALGRKNWLFAGNERGGHAAAVMYSLLASCKAVDVNPYHYLRDVLGRIMAHPHTRVAELLPLAWQESRHGS